MAGPANNKAIVDRVRAVKEAHKAELMAKANVVGLGVGFRQKGGVRTEEVVLVVMVEQKVAETALDPADRIPADVDGVPVDVQAVGQIRAE